MFDDERLKELEDEQRLLVMQCDLERAAMRAEVAALGQRLSWLTSTKEQARQHRGWAYAAVSLVGLMAARYGIRTVRWLPVLAAGWRVARFFIRR